VIVAISGGVAGIADNFVRPLLLRNRTRLNELLLFISVLGGIEVFGLLGIVAGRQSWRRRWVCSVSIWNIATNWKKRRHNALQEIVATSVKT